MPRSRSLGRDRQAHFVAVQYFRDLFDGAMAKAEMRLESGLCRNALFHGRKAAEYLGAAESEAINHGGLDAGGVSVYPRIRRLTLDARQRLDQLYSELEAGCVTLNRRRP